ncbi:ion channel [Henriciella aquimarina]|uniref:ion channel n=1 Tax=Henriciella aquimarina TaxID=545261 RepID=UPI000A001B71|nr:ion channel [Henriciella aquimarina]
MDLIGIFALAGVLATLTCIIHLGGLVALSAFMRRTRAHPAHLTTMIGQGASIIVHVMTIFALHSAQIWVYTIAFLVLGAFDTLNDAVYYSISSFTTVGFGDLRPEEPWHMLGAIESANGFLLIGWSTAFLVSLSSRIRMFEATLEESTAPKPNDG